MSMLVPLPDATGTQSSTNIETMSSHDSSTSASTDTTPLIITGVTVAMIIMLLAVLIAIIMVIVIKTRCLLFHFITNHCHLLYIRSLFFIL